MPLRRNWPGLLGGPVKIEMAPNVNPKYRKSIPGFCAVVRNGRLFAGSRRVFFSPSLLWMYVALPSSGLSSTHVHSFASSLHPADTTNPVMSPFPSGRRVAGGGPGETKVTSTRTAEHRTSQMVRSLSRHPACRSSISGCVQLTPVEGFVVYVAFVLPYGAVFGQLNAVVLAKASPRVL